VWLHAPNQFLDLLHRTTLDHTGFTVASVVLMDICGADYQQFLLAARTPAMARNGCLLMHTLSSHSANPARMLVNVVLLTNALSAGCSILRAMTDATVSLGPPYAGRPIWSRVVPIALGTIVATHGQSLVDMMVDLNMVYISAIGPLVGFAFLNRRIPDRWANATLAIGGSTAVANCIAKWTGFTTIPVSRPLTVFILPLLLIAVLLWRRSTACQENKATENP